MNREPERLEIMVGKTPIEVKEFISYADNQKFFAVGTNGHLYYPNYKNIEKYDLLKADFTKEPAYRQNEQNRREL